LSSVNRRLRCQSYACPLDPINFHPIILADFDAYALLGAYLSLRAPPQH